MKAVRGPNDRSIFARLSRRKLALPVATGPASDENFYFETAVTSPAIQLSVWELINDDDVDPSLRIGDDDASEDDALVPGQTAPVAFWMGNDGQSLVRAFDQGAGAARLGSWLADTLPNLFGPGGHALAGKSNTYVAALVRRIGRAPEPRLEAQVLAVALAAYATNEALGGRAGRRFGFHVSRMGVGACLCNVGTAGASFSAANGSILTVLQLLKALDSRAVQGAALTARDDLRRQACDFLDLLNSFAQSQA